MGLNDVINQFAAEQNQPPAISDKINAELAQLEHLDKTRDGRFFPVSPWVTRLVIALDDTPVTMEDVNRGDPRIRITTGTYSLTYIPKGANTRHGTAEFSLHCDLVGYRLCFANLAHFIRVSKILPELQWLKRNTNFEENLFKICKKHPGLQFPFTLNVAKYVNKILTKMEAEDDFEGLNSADGVFLSHRCSKNDFLQDYRYRAGINYPDKRTFKKLQAQIDEMIPKKNKTDTEGE